MTQRRWLAAALLAILTLGSLSVTLGNAWYVRSASYRESCAASLSETLGLPSEIGRVVPRSRMAREFEDIVVWLPGRRDEAHTCRHAVLRYTGSKEDPDEYELDLTGGSSEISTRTWLRSDYRSVIESGLRPGFTECGPRRVHFGDMRLIFDRNEFRATLSGAGGTIEFDDPQHGRASVVCTNLNGHTPREPVLLTAAFSPRETGIRVDKLELTVPDLPLAIAGLRDLVGLDVRSGTFHGRLGYSEPNGEKHVELSGHCFDVELREFTGGLVPTGWRGTCPEIEMQELRVENRVPTRLRFRGRLSDVHLGDILATWGLRDTTGVLALSVGAADFSQNGIDRFVASGTCIDLDLEKLSKAIGLGAMSGVLRVQIADLTIEDNRLKSLDATLTVADADDPPNWVEGVLLREIARRALKFDLPPIVPPRLEYTRLGVRLEVQDEELHVFGTHGEKERAILTARLLGNEIALINEPHNAFDLTPFFDDLRARARAAIEARLARPADDAGSRTDPRE
jgi:hypothetical protein